MHLDQYGVLNKLSSTEKFKQLISHSCGGWEVKMTMDRYLVSSLFRLQWPTTGCVLRWQRRNKKVPGSHFWRTLIISWVFYLYDITTSQRPIFWYHYTWGWLGFDICIWVGHKDSIHNFMSSVDIWVGGLRQMGFCFPFHTVVNPLS